MKALPSSYLGFARAGLVVTLASVSCVAQSKPTDQPSLLLRDRRLAKQLLIPIASTNTDSLYAKVYRATTVRLYTDEPELKSAPLDIASNSKNAAALMDAISALWLARWEKDPKGRYKLLPSQHEADIFLPKNDAERERAPIAHQFLTDLRQLPPNDRATLLSGRNIPTKILSPEMLGAVRGMADSLNRQHSSGEDDNPFPITRLSESEFRMEPHNQGEFSWVFLTLHLPGWGSMGWMVNDYQKTSANGKGSNKLSTYVPKRFELTPKETLDLPALKQVITIQAKNVSPTQVLRTLHQRYRLPFVSDAAANLKQRTDVQIDALPLSEALNKLTELFPNTDWEYRKLGYLVVRAPNNPARKVKPEEPVEKKASEDEPQ